MSRTGSTRARRVRGAVVSVALGGVFAFSAYAALERLDLGADEPVVREHASNASLSQRTAQLDAVEADLHAALAKAPPKLPPIPKYPPVKKPRVEKPKVVMLVSYVGEVNYEQGKEDKKGDEARREEQRKREEEQRLEERKKREEERKHEQEKRREDEHH